MPSIALTPSIVKGLACAPGATETIYWADDMPGFGLRCRSSGERRWFVQYRNRDGLTRKHTLDAPETLSLAKARAQAKDLQADVTKGQDPAAVAGKVRGLLTVEELVAAYLAHQRQTLRPRSYIEVSRHLGDFYEPMKKLRLRKATTITVRDVVAVLEQVATNNGPVAANRLRATLRAMWSWGLRSQRLTTPSPVTDTFKPAREVSRARVLTEKELQLVYGQAGGGAYGLIVRLLLLTGQRREEVAGMRWSELTPAPDGSALWVLPASRTKNGLEHEVPLVPAAVALLPVRRKIGADHVRDLVFGGGKGGTHKLRDTEATKPGRQANYGEDSFGAWSRSKERLDGRLARARGTKEKPEPVPGWVLHDLRRTFVTSLNNLGIEPHVIEAAVNHHSGVSRAGVAGTYNRSRYTSQVRDAMKVWAAHIGALVVPAGGAHDVGGPAE
ncbi:tyrosine-type recombinase/integrase [Lichenicola sp.]|uniref:tyrosine-type recombinase/integrase n=1 Tax=Lichenicola sp. TaxID=2804529 RepID=UPI003B00A367